MPNAARYAEIRARGICGKCKIRPAVNGTTKCSYCIAATTQQCRSWYERNQERHARRQREIRAQRAAENRCTRCGQPLDSECDPGYSRCIFCRELDP